MQLTLISRSESVGNQKLQLQFSEVGSEGTYGSGVSLSGWFDREAAMAYTVGQRYELALTPVEGA